MPDSKVQEIIADSSGIKLEGMGDARAHDFMQKLGFQDIGFERKFETMAFPLGDKVCDTSECGCGAPIPDDWSESDFAAYNTIKEATLGHEETCMKYDMDDVKEEQ